LLLLLLLLLLLRVEELLLLLHDDGLDNAMDGRASELRGYLGELAATLLAHDVAAALLHDLRPEKWHI
jgi:hypothetical protein